MKSAGAVIAFLLALIMVAALAALRVCRLPLGLPGIPPQGSPEHSTWSSAPLGLSLANF